MLPPEYTYRTPHAYTLHPANPPRRDLTGRSTHERDQIRVNHHRTWLSHRNQGLGSSDASTILGVNPRSSLTELYAQKIHGYAPDDNDLMRLGRELEAIAADRFTEATDLKLRRSGLLANREQPWMRCTPDRLTSDGGGLEIKTTTERDHRNEWDDAPSDHALVQAQWCMAVTGLTHWWVAVLFRDTGKFEYYRVDRDDGLIETIVLRAAEFWHGNILQRCRPPLDGSPATMDAVRELHPDTTPDKEFDGGERAAAVLRRLARIEREKKRLEREESQEKAELLSIAGDADVLYGNGTKVATLRRNGTFKTKKYTEDHPERAEKFTRKVDKLDHRAAIAEDPEAIHYIPRVIRPIKLNWSWGYDLSGVPPETTTRERLMTELASTA